jgi:carbon monoxide dehydrogenase subunit G
VGAVNSDVSTIEARVRAASDFLDQSKLNVSITCDVGGNGGFAGFGGSSS